MVDFVKEVFSSRRILFNMAFRDFKSKYIGSYLGMIWGIFNPLATILVYWAVFEFGLKVMDREDGTPFVIWFITGMVPWFFILDAINSGTTSIIEYNYLVKKIVFKVKLLPLLKIISASFLYFLFLIINLIILSVNGYEPTLYWLQGILLLLFMYIFVMSIIYFTSALTPFFKDLPQIVSLFLQLGFWITPIMWDFSIVPDNLTWFLYINPIFYIIEGFRSSFLYNELIWESNPGFVIVFIVTFLFFLVSLNIFKKLEPHLSDQL